MEEFDIGVVLVARHGHHWSDIVPCNLIHDNPANFEIAIRRMIDRQLAFKRLHECSTRFQFTPCMIILDSVELESLNMVNIGIPNVVELRRLLDMLAIKVMSATDEKFRGKKLFPLAWDWKKQAVGKKEINVLSKSGSIDAVTVENIHVAS